MISGRLVRNVRKTPVVAANYSFCPYWLQTFIRFCPPCRTRLGAPFKSMRPRNRRNNVCCSTFPFRKTHGSSQCNELALVGVILQKLSTLDVKVPSAQRKLAALDALAYPWEGHQVVQGYL